VLIVGKPNAGKSSLLNQLLNENRAIVTHIPGTTRDIIEETVNMEGLSVRLLDTAGIRHTDDLVEQEGIKRALEKVPLADLVLAVFDSSREISSEDRLLLDELADTKTIAVLNKSDLHQTLVLPEKKHFVDLVRVAAISGDGIDVLKKTICRQFLHSTAHDPREYAGLTRARHKDALMSAELCLQKFTSGFSGCNLELLALDLREALQAVGSITGHAATDEILDLIFSSFCIGK
jgi:tRNA modification GTPase